MKRKILFLFCILLPAFACQVIPTPPALTPTAARGTVPPTLPSAALSIPNIQPVQTKPATSLSSIPDAPEIPFALPTAPDWQPAEYIPLLDTLPLNLNNLANQAVLAGLTGGQRKFLRENGFVVIQDAETNFGSLRQQVSEKNGQPYYLTTDAAANALQQTLDQSIYALEREVLAPRLSKVVQATLDEIQRNLPNLPGSIIEKDARQALAYLAVGCKLLDPQVQLILDDEMDRLVEAQIDQILQAQGVQNLVVIPTISLDFSIFSAPSFYAGDASLQAYHRGLSWFTYASFPLDSVSQNLISRAPLIIAMALRKAAIADQSAMQAWVQMDEILAFLYGRSQGDDPRRYAALMDRVYGDGYSILSLSDEAYWQNFRSLALAIPVAPAYSFLGSVSLEFAGEKSWRFLGVRRSLDEFAFSYLVSEAPNPSGIYQENPSAVDFMAALGSQAADQLFRGAGSAPKTTTIERMQKIQAGFQQRTGTQWLSTMASTWHYAFLPRFSSREGYYPPYMQTQAWSEKDLQSSLAGWATLAHRLAFQSAFVDFQDTSAAGRPISPPAPGFVEPDPLVFYRLANLAAAFVDGVRQRDLPGLELPAVKTWLQELQDLGDHFARLGELAARELDGGTLDAADFAVIQAHMGLLEQAVAHSQDSRLDTRLLSLPAAARITRDSEMDYYIGAGRLDRIFVAVPLNGELVIAQGGVFSFYEISRPTEKPLFDEEWRWIVANAQPQRPGWSTAWLIPGGSPVNVLAFRIGDFYRITSSGANLSVRNSPEMGIKPSNRLHPGDTVEFIAGPEVVGGVRWWKIKSRPVGGELIEGWVIESAEWFERAWD